ncbi:MAG: type II toxin-antitoxin system PemK/MazF family toxin [Epsilonproteobacteria bacterium]|nr:type II toxin-antitoxin system PemK/MazF family toxin [Campylobacterota bacterium]
MVGDIYYINMPYSNFTKSKGRPVLVYQNISKDDVLVLPLTSNLTREGFKISTKDIADGSLKKDSVIIVPKLTAVDSSLIKGSKFIASLKQKSFLGLKKKLCEALGC